MKIERTIPNALIFCLSHKCPVNCDFCCVSPPSQDKLTVEECVKWIKQAKDTSNFKYIGITGGDPFYFYDDVVQILKEAHVLSFKSSIITSAYWADNTDIVSSRMMELSKLGLERINISCDPGHQVRVPITNVSLLSEISHKLGIKVVIVGTFEDSKMNLENYLKSNFIKVNSDITLLTKYIAPYGRAKNIDGSLKKYGLSLKFCDMYCYKASGFDIAIWPDGKIYPCCSTANIESPLIMGNLRTDNFNEVMENTLGNVFFRVIKRGNFQDLIDICEKYGYSIKNYLPSEGEISGPCGLCTSLQGNPITKSLIKNAMSLYEVDLIKEIINTYSA